jgi:hypothetical protein
MWQRAFVLAPLRELAKTPAGRMRGTAWADARARLAAALRDAAITAQRITIAHDRTIAKSPRSDSSHS